MTLRIISALDLSPLGSHCGADSHLDQRLTTSGAGLSFTPRAS